MIRRITLQNYMSHAHTVIEPAAGLTVLVGPNNCGKSAVVSALETLCNNAAGAYMVRHDEKEARVTLETDDGHTFVWKRRGNVVSYIIDGREVHRVGRTVPEDLHKLLRLPKVDPGENGDPFDIHFGTQKSPIFLLNEPESRAALFFASSSDAAILLEMQKRHRNKVRDRKNDEKRLKGEIEKLDGELAALEPLKTIADSLAEVDSDYLALGDLQNHILAMKGEIQTLQSQTAKHGRLAREYQCMASLKAAPNLEDASSFKLLTDALEEAEQELQREHARSAALQPLATPPALDDTVSLSEIVRALAPAEKNASLWSASSQALKLLPTPPALEDAERVESLHRALAAEQEHHQLLEGKVACLGLLKDVPTVAETGPLERTWHALESAQRATLALSRLRLVLEDLRAPPEIVETKPLANLMVSLEETSQEIERQKGLIAGTAPLLAKLETVIRAAEREGTGHFSPDSSDRWQRRYIVLALACFAGMAAVVLLYIFGPGWFGRLNTESSDRARDPLGPTALVVAKANKRGETGPLPASPHAAEKEPLQQSKKEQPKKEEPNGARQLRIKKVRELLNEAEMASKKGNNLEAVLGFGQVAVLYPQELAEVESPENVRLKFLDALKRYQADVEQALRTAAEQKPHGK